MALISLPKASTNITQLNVHSDSREMLPTVSHATTDRAVDDHLNYIAVL